VQIRWRSVMAACTCLYATVLVSYCQHHQFWLLHLSGLTLANAIMLLVPLLSVVLLFVGPIMEAVSLGFSNPFAIQDGWVSLRDFIVAPITEEWAFRLCLMSILRGAGYGFGPTLLVGSALFAASHLHHAIALKAQGLPINVIFMRVGFQFAFTFLFGLLSGFWFHGIAVSVT
jgi:prenyl protein peptidase